MHKHLYFVCPTDHLETIIDQRFQKENYYVTSLGNSVTFNPELIEEINALIETKNITDITFVLSDNNKMIVDGYKNQNFGDVKGLKSFYSIIKDQKKSIETVWETVDVPIITHWLNSKINELESVIPNWLADKITVDALIYNREKNTFNQVQSNLFQLENYSLN